MPRYIHLSFNWRMIDNSTWINKALMLESGVRGSSVPAELCSSTVYIKVIGPGLEEFKSMFYSFATALHTSGVTSRGANPVPPVVRIMSTSSSSLHVTSLLCNAIHQSCYSKEAFLAFLQNEKRTIFWLRYGHFCVSLYYNFPLPQSTCLAVLLERTQ